MATLFYKDEPRRWTEGLPIGNGRLGAMVGAGQTRDVIHLNEDTLWSGYPGRDSYTFDKAVLAEVRELLRHRRYPEAEARLLEDYPMQDVGAYLCFGRLEIERDTSGFEASSYRRELDLSTAICKSRLGFWSGFSTEREYFASFADDILVFHTQSTQKNNHYLLHFEPYLRHQAERREDGITLWGVCPAELLGRGKDTGRTVYDETKPTVRFAAELKILTDGALSDHGGVFGVYNATYMTVLLSIATSFGDFQHPRAKDERALCREKMEAALSYSYEELRARHIEAYQKEFSGTEISFAGEDKSDVPTNERIVALAKGKSDPALIATLYEYGRYLLLSSSREGSQPANLQGIWCKDINAPWRSDYTMNINAQMNYWGAEQAGLASCHMPFLEMLRDLSKTPNHHGGAGWYCAHNTDLWRNNLEASTGLWGYWQMGGVWSCRHIYEHYLFTLDEDFLQAYFPVLEGAETFLSSHMIEEEGYLTTSPSESPENRFVFEGKKCSIATGTGMDLSLIAEFYEYFPLLCEALGKDGAPYRAKREKIKPLSIGKDGRLLEWNEDFEEAEPGHRHISHLCGYFPCNLYGEESPYFAAMKKSLEARLANGGGGTGWSNAWIANLYARMKEPKEVYTYLRRMFEKSMYSNMLDAHPPFQIDGNFGVMCAISEMLVQSHRGKLELLPACPTELSTGEVKNIRARGGYGVSMTFEKGRVTSLTITDKDGRDCTEALISAGKVIFPTEK